MLLTNSNSVGQSAVFSIRPGVNSFKYQFRKKKSWFIVSLWLPFSSCLVYIATGNPFCTSYNLFLATWANLLHCVLVYKISNYFHHFSAFLEQKYKLWLFSALHINFFVTICFHIMLVFSSLCRIAQSFVIALWFMTTIICHAFTA